VSADWTGHELLLAKGDDVNEMRQANENEASQRLPKSQRGHDTKALQPKGKSCKKQ